VTAIVRDAETAVDQLRLAWTATAGTFSGTGPSVRWRAPKGPVTPADYTITLTVTETYGTGQQNVVSATSPAVRVHDSPQEVGDLSMRFLSDFANSGIPADLAVREFADSCNAGKREEREQIENNRRRYTIQSSTLVLRSVRLRSPVAGDARVSCEFLSINKNCIVSDGPDCKVGASEHVAGNCDLTTVYEQRRWWLCTSAFNDGVLLPSRRPFHGWH
jgi:hypothetical protein